MNFLVGAQGWRRTVVRLLAGAAACGIAGCAASPSEGYSFENAYRSDVQTIAVPVFDNRSFDHGLEFTLTDALVKELHRSTPYRVVTSDAADSTLSGAIRSAELRRLTRRTETGLIQELAYEIDVDFEWKQRRTGKPLVVRNGFRSAEAFVPARGGGERLAMGQQAAVDELAKQIVAEMRSAW